jgi:hypothetical protein
MTWRALALAVPVLFALGAALIVGVGDVGELPRDDFHSAAAQIIPVLLLALVVEGQSNDLWGTPEGRPVRTVVLLMLLLGELSALLETGDILARDELSAAITAAGLVGGFVAVVLVALLPPGDRPQSVARGRRR